MGRRPCSRTCPLVDLCYVPQVFQHAEIVYIRMMREGSPSTNPPDRAVFERKAKERGFLGVGFSPAEAPLYLDTFLEWIAADRHAGMHWMAKHAELRRHPAALLEGCRTVISLAYPYSPRKPATPDGFEAARFTEPRLPDYHNRLRKHARPLLDLLRSWDPRSRNRICIDSAPILERSFALRAGVGFIGKNNLLIVPGYGSYVFLLEILTTIPLTPTLSTPPKDQCGSCNRCVEACPSGALSGPRLFDASLCLSYRTIESRDPLGANAAEAARDCFFGCDVCQEVCPFNPPPGTEDPCLPGAADILAMDTEAFAARFGTSAFARAGLEKIKGNLLAIMQSGSTRRRG